MDAIGGRFVDLILGLGEITEAGTAEARASG